MSETIGGLNCSFLPHFSLCPQNVTENYELALKLG
jgi:hypothetical protein